MTELPPLTVCERLLALLDEEGGRIPVLVGLCGSGRTTALRAVGDVLGADGCQYVDVERTATTPERFLVSLLAGTPFGIARPAGSPSGSRQAFDAVLAFFAEARGAAQNPATFLLDEALEFRTFESFPGLRHAMPELLAVLAASPNRFVLSSRYVARTSRVIAAAPSRFAIVPVPALSVDDIRRMLRPRSRLNDAPDSSAGGDALATAAYIVHHLSEGRAAYAHALVEALTTVDACGPIDPVAALAALLEPGSRVASLCTFGYELRLHRARGYGALKAILDILAAEEPLTLTEVARRLGRTPGSTKDYLSWLEDVDLIAAHRKRYRFSDPVMRIWVRLHCRPVPPATEDIGREVQQYAASRLSPAR